ncbi:MAG: hypothetical protein D6675_13230 [Gemmatimonadetes bacterium]|nr:MAG: hypothetical protein D6675_13230 [Gemmatimonadota bacterium]
MFSPREIKYIAEIFGIKDVFSLTADEFKIMRRKAFHRWHPDKRRHEDPNKANQRFMIIKKLADKVDFFLKTLPEERARMSGQLMVAEPLLDFGTVYVGDQPVLSVEVWTPSGDADMWQFIRPKENWLTLDKSGNNLEVKVNARRAGRYSTKISIWGNGEWAEVQVKVEVIDRHPLKLSKSRLDFGKAEEGQTFEDTINILSDVQWFVSRKPDWIEVEANGNMLQLKTTKLPCGSFLDKVVIDSYNSSYKSATVFISVEVYPQTMVGKFKNFMSGGLP